MIVKTANVFMSPLHLLYKHKHRNDYIPSCHRCPEEAAIKSGEKELADEVELLWNNTAEVIVKQPIMHLAGTLLKQKTFPQV